MNPEHERIYSKLSHGLRHFIDGLPDGCTGEMATELDGLLDSIARDLAAPTRSVEPGDEK